MRAILLALAALLLMPAAAAQAQESACVAIEDDAARLACYDAANGRTPRAAPALERPAAVSESPRAVPASAAGEMYQVARVTRRGGQVLMVMANGEVWAAAREPERAPEDGEQVVIRREGVGYYLLTPATGEPFRVRPQ